MVLTEKLRQTLAIVLRCDLASLSENPQRKDFTEWDSLAQLRIIASLEDQFQIEFTDQQVVELSSCQEFVQAVSSLLEER